MSRSPEPLPEARTHLPKPVERYLMKAYGGSALGRIKAAAVLRALSVLVRKHPRATLETLWAGMVQAGRAGASELRNRFRKGSDEKAGAPADFTAPRRSAGKLQKTQAASDSPEHHVVSISKHRRPDRRSGTPAVEASTRASESRKVQAAPASRSSKPVAKAGEPRPNGHARGGVDSAMREELVERLGERGLNRIRKDLHLGEE